MKVYVTKYALTQGILEKEVKSVSPTFVATTCTRWDEFYHKPYWYETLEEAYEHAEKLRKDKIKSLQKQIDKLNKIEFNKDNTQSADNSLNGQ